MKLYKPKIPPGLVITQKDHKSISKALDKWGIKKNYRGKKPVVSACLIPERVRLALRLLNEMEDNN